MNTQLHMTAFVLNPKWYVEFGERGLPCDDPEVLDGLIEAFDKMYLVEEASNLVAKFPDFTKSHKRGWIEWFWQ